MAFTTTNPNVKKPFWKSWTIIGNAVAIVIILLQVANNVELFGTSTDVQTIVIAALNILVRFKTNIGVSVK